MESVAALFSLHSNLTKLRRKGGEKRKAVGGPKN